MSIKCYSRNLLMQFEEASQGHLPVSICTPHELMAPNDTKSEAEWLSSLHWHYDSMDGYNRSLLVEFEEAGEPLYNEEEEEEEDTKREREWCAGLGIFLEDACKSKKTIWDYQFGDDPNYWEDKKHGTSMFGWLSGGPSGPLDMWMPVHRYGRDAARSAFLMTKRNAWKEHFVSTRKKRQDRQQKAMLAKWLSTGSCGRKEILKTRRENRLLHIAMVRWIVTGACTSPHKGDI